MRLEPAQNVAAALWAHPRVAVGQHHPLQKTPGASWLRGNQEGVEGLESDVLDAQCKGVGRKKSSHPVAKFVTDSRIKS